VLEVYLHIFLLTLTYKFINCHCKIAAFFIFFFFSDRVEWTDIFLFKKSELILISQ